MVLTNDFVVVCVQTKEERDTASEVATMGSCGGRSAPTVPFYPGQGIRIRIDSHSFSLLRIWIRIQEGKDEK